MNIPVVTLDAGNTLFTERWGRDEMYARALSDRGCPRTLTELAESRERIHAAMPESWNGHQRYTEGWFRGYVERLLADLRCPLDVEEFRAELAALFARPDSFVIFGDTLPALEGLVESGTRLAVVSNWSDQLHGLLEGLGLRPYFEAVVVSAEIGHSKPARGIFDHALKALDVTADQVVHVGDHPVNDLGGARRAGWTALLLDRRGIATPGGHVVHSLEDVPGRLSDPRVGRP